MKRKKSHSSFKTNSRHPGVCTVRCLLVRECSIAGLFSYHEGFCPLPIQER